GGDELAVRAEGDGTVRLGNRVDDFGRLCVPNLHVPLDMVGVMFVHAGAGDERAVAGERYRCQALRFEHAFALTGGNVEEERRTEACARAQTLAVRTEGQDDELAR